MKIERTKNAIRNAKWGVLEKIIHIFLPFLVRTILIHVLSAEYAGISSLFASILQVLSLAELGFSNAIVYSMYKPIAEDDKTKICALLNIYRKAYRVIGAVILILGLAVLPFIPKLIHGEVPVDTNLYYLYLINLLNTVLSYFLFAYQTSLLAANQRDDVLSKNTLILNVFCKLTQCVVLLVFKNYYAYVIILPFTTVLLNLLNHYAVKKMFPDYMPVGDISEDEKKELKKNIAGLMIWKVGGATRNTLDSIVISMYLGLISVAMYNNYMYIVSGVTTFLRVILTSISAGVGNKITTESPEKNYQDFQKFHFYYMWITGWCTVCMMCLFQPFMKIWMGKDLMFPNYIMFLFCYYFVMMKQGDMNSIYYQAAGLWWHGKFRSIIEALLNLSLNIVLGKMMGVAGIILATIISWTIVYFYGSKFVFTKYFKNGKIYKYYKDNLIYMIITLSISYLMFVIIENIDINNQIVSLIVKAVVCAILPNIIFLLIYRLSSEKRKYILEGIAYMKKHFFNAFKRTGEKR